MEKIEKRAAGENHEECERREESRERERSEESKECERSEESRERERNEESKERERSEESKERERSEESKERERSEDRGRSEKSEDRGNRKGRGNRKERGNREENVNRKDRRRSGNQKKRALWPKIVIIAVIVLLIAVIAAGNYMVSYALGRSGSGGDRTASMRTEEASSETERILAENKAEQKILTDDFLSRAQEETVEIISDDGLALSGAYYENEGHLWAIIIHGYRSIHEYMNDYAERYYDAGYRVLMPDLRACGESEGDYTGMGWLDRLDILKWIDWIVEKDPEAKIVLHGISMGGATVMMTSGEETPDAVKVFVEDCGYTDVWSIFSSELKIRFHLPDFPIMYSASLMAKIRAGYGFGEASALEQVKKCEKPMLFIHGSSDNFVPFEMLDILYEAKPGDNKAKIVAEGAAHAESMNLLGDEYWEGVFAFIDEYISD